MVSWVEAELFPRPEPAGVLEFKDHRRGAGFRVDPAAALAAHLVERFVESRGDRLIVNPQRERTRLVCRDVRGNEVDRLSGRRLVFLEPPVQDAGAAVGQDNLANSGINDDLAFRRLAFDWRERWDWCGQDLRCLCRRWRG